jgi:hypothetical protein
MTATIVVMAIASIGVLAVQFSNYKKSQKS